MFFPPLSSELSAAAHQLWQQANPKKKQRKKCIQQICSTRLGTSLTSLSLSIFLSPSLSHSIAILLCCHSSAFCQFSAFNQINRRLLSSLFSLLSLAFFPSNSICIYFHRIHMLSLNVLSVRWRHYQRSAPPTLPPYACPRCTLAQFCCIVASSLFFRRLFCCLPLPEWWELPWLNSQRLPLCQPDMGVVTQGGT